ncbi:hypothetical protein SOVF_120050 [Spinacia oleracea]|nr:hypothetical protein SOVF_120050 [Spinacia oleracea]
MQKLSRKNFEKKVVENYYSDCRNRFKAWHELKTKWTGIGWNEYGCVQVDTNSEKWKSFVHLHKGRPSAFLKRPLPFERKMQELFTGSFATGNLAWANNSTGPSLFDLAKVVDI